MKIDQIVDHAIMKMTQGVVDGSLDIRSIIYAAVEQGMRDAYERGKNENA